MGGCKKKRNKKIKRRNSSRARTSSTASSIDNGSGATSKDNPPVVVDVQAQLQPELPAEADPVTRVPSTSSSKEKSPSPKPSKLLVANTPVANTCSEDLKDESLVSISPTPLGNYVTPSSQEVIASPPPQPPVEECAEEGAENEPEPTENDPVASEEIKEPEVTTEPIRQNENGVISEVVNEDVRVDRGLSNSNSVKTEELKRDDVIEIEHKDAVIEEHQPNGHVDLEEGEIRDDEDNEEEVAQAVVSTENVEQDDASVAKGKIKYDRETLLSISRNTIGEFKVAECGLPDLARDNLSNHIKSHGSPPGKNSSGGPRGYDRARGLSHPGNKGPLLSHQGLGHIRMANMGIGGMQWGLIMPPPPPNRMQPKVQITLQREDVKLHKAENAWKPNTLKRTHGDQTTDEEALMIESIVKKTRGILNKLTPDNFDKLVSQFMELSLEDKDERISSVISVVFEKAIDEPSFSTAYARMVQTVCKTSPETSKKFRKQILDQCQKEFQKNNTEEAEIKGVEQKLAEATDEESRDQLKSELEEKKYLSRRRSLGNVRFIGELYKLQMLTPKIMVECVQLLLFSPDDEKLECLCKLLSTVGQRLDTQLQNLEDQVARGGEKPKFVPEQRWMSKIFRQLQDLSEDKKRSSRIRFAILDVVELRDNKWVPRRDANAPTTIAEVRKEASRQELEEKRQISNLPIAQNSNGNGGSGTGSGDRDNRSGGSRLPQGLSQKKSDWTTIQNKTSRFTTVKKPEPVGATPLFGPPSWGPGQPWGQKIQPGPPKPPLPPRFANRYANLQEDGSRAHNNKGIMPNSSDSSGFRGDQNPIFAPLPSLVAPSSPPQSVSSSAQNSRPDSPKDSSETCTANTSESVKNIFQEYLSSLKFDDTLHWIKKRFPGNKIDEFVEEMAKQVAEMNKEVEQKSAGSLVRLLIKNKEISKESTIKLMAQGVMQDLPDILIDSPMATTYLAQFLVEIFSDEENLNWLVQVGDRLIESEDDVSAWNDLAVSSLNLLKLKTNEEFVQTSFRQTEAKNVIPVDEIPWLQDKTPDSLSEKMIKVLTPKLNSDSPEEIGQILQENSWDVREEIMARALTEAICTLTWSPETGSWNDERVKKLLPLLALPNQNMLPIIWKQVEDYLKRKSIDKKKGEGLWGIMYSLNMTRTSSD